MTEQVFNNLKDGDTIVYKDVSARMTVMKWDYYGDGTVITCFADETSIYPATEFDISEWFVVKNGIVINE